MDERMLKEKYCQAMNNIPVRNDYMQTEVEKRLHEKTGSKWYLKVAAACIVLLVVAVGVLPMIRNAGVVMNVYAADGSRFAVDKEGVALSGYVQPRMGAYTQDVQNPEMISGTQAFYFLIGCDHENVDKITYSIEGEHTVDQLKDKGENEVWFAKELILSEEEYVKKKSEESGVGIYKFLQFPSTKEYIVYEYIGSSYTVAKENQFNEAYCVEFRTNYDNGVWTAEEFQITVLLEMKNGSTVKKKLLLQPIPKDATADTPEYEVYVKEI